MSERQQRRRSWWVARGAIGVAIVAVLFLAITVLLARRALDRAADLMARGDGESLVAKIVVDLWEVQWPLTAEEVAAVLRKYEPRGLRYLAVVNRVDQHILAQAGDPTIATPITLPRDLVRQGSRVRLIALIPPPWETRAVPPSGQWLNIPDPRPHLIVEVEPPILEQLHNDLVGLSLIAAAAAIALIGFALALSLTRARLAKVEQQSERERTLAVLGRASSVIAHELRNPLAALKGHAQLLVEDLQEPSKARAARVVEGAERLEHLTSVLLDYVRGGPLDVRSVTPSELIDRALSELPRERVRVDLSGAPRTLRVDPERAALALGNLVQNAVQAGADEGALVEVRVRGVDTEEHAKAVSIEVRDHGPGLALGSEERIFEPFVTTKARGTGLGLFLARRIAEQHHGTLTGETHRDGGAIFRLILPLAPNAKGFQA
jgi:two-component system sensor histidine kinase HydH